MELELTPKHQQKLENKIDQGRKNLSLPSNKQHKLKMNCVIEFEACRIETRKKPKLAFSWVEDEGY